MHISCSIYVLFALRFLCTVSAEELDADRCIEKLIVDQGGQLKNIVEEINGTVVEFDGKVVDLKEDIEDLGKQLNTVNYIVVQEFNDIFVEFDGKVANLNNGIAEFDSKVTDLNEIITDLGGQLKITTDDLNGVIVDLKSY